MLKKGTTQKVLPSEDQFPGNLSSGNLTKRRIGETDLLKSEGFEKVHTIRALQNANQFLKARGVLSKKTILKNFVNISQESTYVGVFKSKNACCRCIQNPLILMSNLASLVSIALRYFIRSPVSGNNVGSTCTS